MRTVTVSGRGTAREVPDTVVVRVAASHRAAGVAEALAGADSAATEIVTVGREHTDASRIASTSLDVWPAYDNQGLPNGFEARHSLSITCTDVQAAGSLLAELATRVGDRLQVEGLGLEVGDTRRALDQARAAAYADAVARATHLAGLTGGRLGAVQAVSEGGSPGEVGAMPAATSRDMKAVSIEPGETTIGAMLTITFELEGFSSGPY
jgi:uncharacterized protein YggE